MALDTLRRALIFLILCLSQALVFNRIQLFNCATPLLYVYFVIMFPLNYPKWGILLWSFMMGLVVDMFANTPGVACASLTFVGAVQPYLLLPFLPRDPDENHKTSASGLGWGKFITFTFMLTLMHCLLFYTLEFFNFFNWQHWLECIGGSTLLTTLLIVTFESFRIDTRHTTVASSIQN